MSSQNLEARIADLETQRDALQWQVDILCDTVATLLATLVQNEMIDQVDADLIPVSGANVERPVPEQHAAIVRELTDKLSSGKSV
ncbi:MAG: hypothetical protein ABID63_18350 [Pseudomonadota bacterium]